MRKHKFHRPAATAVERRFEIFVVEAFDTDDGKARTRIGFARESADHQSFHIELTALPMTGKLVMRLRDTDVL